MRLPSRIEIEGKRFARGLVGAISPRLLREMQLARARRLYLREPTRGPRRLLLEPTTSCNHHCEMCWDHSPRQTNPTPTWTMPFDQIERLLKDMASLGTEEVWLAGRGEPLIHPQGLEIFRLLNSLKMRSLVTTNGHRLTEELADRLCVSGLKQISVSIDSGNPETYSRVHHTPPENRARILRVIEHMSKCEENKPTLLVSMVLSKLNCTEVLDFARDAIAAGVSGIMVGGMRPVPFDSRDLSLSDDDWAKVRDDLAKVGQMAKEAGIELRTDNIRPEEKSRAETQPYKQMACFIGHLFSVVDVHGIVHGCCTCQNKLGNLDEADFRDIWRARPYRLFRQILRDMPNTGLTTPRCECQHGCGHIPENAALQQELGFKFTRRETKSDYATRLDAVRAICRRLGAMLPDPKKEAKFADLSPEQVDERTLRGIAQLRWLGIDIGIGSFDGQALFEPRRMIAWEEFEETLTRAIAEIKGREISSTLITETRGGAGHPAEPLTIKDMESWLQLLSEKLTSANS